MSEKNQLFRKVSLDRLSSPEQLDALMQVTSAKGWVALLAICGLLFMALLWGIWGSIPTRITGSCILIRPGGVSEVVANGGGRVADISVDVGDLVREGQMIARIERLDALEQIRSVEAKLHELKQQEERLKKVNALSADQQAIYLQDSQRNLSTRIHTAQERLAALEAKIQSQSTLLDQGLITRQTLLSTKLEYASVQQEIDTHRNEIRQLDVRRLDSKKQIDNELTAISIQINEATRSLAGQMRSFQEASQVYSPYTGRVLEVRLSENTMVSTGAPILSIERTGDNLSDLEAHIYVQPTDGKKIKANMDVQIAPSMVKGEEFGFMLGKVKTVAKFPSTAPGMMRIFNNDKLVQQLAAGAAPIAVLADLIPSASTPSGYKWSSPRGPDTEVESGTLCSATITVRQQRPITLVIPMLRSTLGL
ncbi:MAG: Membrane-fusion protein [Comamonadaceae bacterium]|nr:MAG: Membrane-fusion protein [Comamonadaceae bacterium]